MLNITNANYHNPCYKPTRPVWIDNVRFVSQAFWQKFLASNKISWCLKAELRSCCQLSRIPASVTRFFPLVSTSAVAIQRKPKDRLCHVCKYRYALVCSAYYALVCTHARHHCGFLGGVASGRRECIDQTFQTSIRRVTIPFSPVRCWSSTSCYVRESLTGIQWKLNNQTCFVADALAPRA